MRKLPCKKKTNPLLPADLCIIGGKWEKKKVPYYFKDAFILKTKAPRKYNYQNYLCWWLGSCPCPPPNKTYGDLPSDYITIWKMGKALPFILLFEPEIITLIIMQIGCGWCYNKESSIWSRMIRSTAVRDTKYIVYHLQKTYYHQYSHA